MTTGRSASHDTTTCAPINGQGQCGVVVHPTYDMKGAHVSRSTDKRPMFTRRHVMPASSSCAHTNCLTSDWLQDFRRLPQPVINVTRIHLWLAALLLPRWPAATIISKYRTMASHAAPGDIPCKSKTASPLKNKASYIPFTRPW